MTYTELRERIAAIRDISGDAEAAHAAEDQLWGDVLAAIASGVAEPSRLAAFALTTREIEFERWYA